MVFSLKIAVCAILVASSAGSVLRGEPAKVVAKDTKKVAAVKPAVAAPAKAAAPVKVEKKQSEAETLEALGKGLKTIHNLRALFTAKKDVDAPGSEKFANGALSEELSNKDSQVWATIETMIGATQNAMTSIKGKSKAEREQVMASLESDLDGKAKVLSNVNDDVSKKQQEQDEEYLLGLLLLHKDNWSMEKQLNATETFMHGSPILQKLFEHHDESKALAPQLAAMMDEAKKGKVAAAKVAPAAKAPVKAAAAKATPVKAAKKDKKPLAKAASAAAKTMFIQLTDTFLSRDCPYCAAQCVDKCHQAGKPYVQCLTDCADAGKS